MSSKKLVTVAVFELDASVEVAGQDPRPRLADVATRGPLVGKGSQTKRSERNCDSVEPLRRIDASIHMIVSFARNFLSELIRLGLRAGSGSLSGVLLTLVLLIILGVGNPTPTPTPTPIPF